MALSPFSLADRTAVVLGGTSGLGRTLALGLADAGAMWLFPRAGRHRRWTASEIEAKGRRHSEFCLTCETKSRLSDSAMPF